MNYISTNSSPGMPSVDLGRIALVESTPCCGCGRDHSLALDHCFNVVYKGTDLPTQADDILKKDPDVVVINLRPTKSVAKADLFPMIQACVAKGIKVMILGNGIDQMERSSFFKAGISTYCLQEVDIETLCRLIDLNFRRKVQQAGRKPRVSSLDLLDRQRPLS